MYYGSPFGIAKDNFVTLESNQDGMLMGSSIADGGDINGDGYGDVVIGATGYHNGQFDEGAVFVCYGSSSGLSIAYSSILESNQVEGLLGHSVSTAGDINADGYGDIIVGCPYCKNSSSGNGTAFIYYGSKAGIQQQEKIIEIDQSALFGFSVSNAGDINGDGYDDVLVGAPTFDNGQSGEGALFVYQGSEAGINTSSAIHFECDQAYAYMGWSVFGAGDVNGDGYSDVVTGAKAYKSGENKEGAGFIFMGSTDGLNAEQSEMFEGSQPWTQFGYSIGGRGDFNGDGFSDILFGAPYLTEDKTNQGAAFIYYGNSGKNLRNNLRLYNSDLATPINHSQFSKNNFGAGLFARSFLGRGKGAMVWETKAKGQAFSKGANSLITNSTQFTNRSLFNNLGLGGTEIKSVISKQGSSTKVRVRVKYDPTTALTGQIYGPWRYLPAYLTGNNTAPVPVNAMAETVKRKVESSEKEKLAESISVYPNPVSDKIFIDTKNPQEIQGLQLMTSTGKSVYRSAAAERTVDVKNLESGFYILIITHTDGSQVSKKVVIRR